MKREKLWFRAKYYGWGWYPVSWQGWVVIILYVLALAVDILLVLPRNKQNPTPGEIMTFLGIAAGLTLLLIYVSYKTGEEPRWRWGRGDK